MLKGWCKKIRDFLWGVPGDIRNSVVSAIVASLVTFFWAATPPKSVSIYLSNDGYAVPLSAMLSAVNREETPVSYVADPPELERAYVCEYATVSGASAKEILEQYIDKYSMCFSINQKSEKEFTVRPNLKSGALVRTNRAWFCKCPAQ